MNGMKKLLLLAMLFTLPTAVLAQTEGWVNPMTLPGLQNRSLGDPYMMKYRGYYYLYVSADDRNIYCWRTKDLMEWSSAYVCCTDETTAVAYAPEVIYWNGLFYMVTSPRGGGHYILTSESPLGPFVHKTNNMGRDIDGSLFVDDDGKWYFYHANYEGIHACNMPTHLSFGNDVNLGCRMSGQWTEGPCVFKRNNLYYLIYTGNHVWTNGYRIDYAMSRDGALQGFVPQSEQNPILIDTETPEHRALGHGTAFVGPDLDTYFFCYHNLLPNHSRRLFNLERIGWNGDKMMMTGPTCWKQDRPLVASNDYFERAEIGSDWLMADGGQWQIVDNDHLSQTKETGIQTAVYKPCSYDSYTAEFTIRLPKTGDGLAGIVFSRQDDANFTEALINATNNTLVLNNYVDGNVQATRSVALPSDFDPTCWHGLRVEKNAKRVRIYIDGMRKFNVQLQETGGQVGYITHDCAADFGYIAISPFVDGSGIQHVSLPVPGMIAANFCHDKSDNVSSVGYSMRVGTTNFMRCQAGSQMHYNVNVQADNVYNIGLRYRSSANAQVRLLIDGQVVADNITLPNTRNSIVVQTVNNVPMLEGHHQMTVEVVDGTLQFYEYNIKRGVKSPHVMADNFDSGLSSEWGYQEGNWTIVDGQLESTGGYGKMLMGGFDDIHLTDYTVECDVIYTSDQMNGGLLFRTTNASTGGADDNPVLGTDFLQGYIFLAGTTSVALGKHNYGWQSLASANKTVSITEPHHMKVEVKGANIKCYLDDMDKPLIDYTDPMPFITGRAGFRAHSSSIRFDNFVVTPATEEQTSIEKPSFYQTDSLSVLRLYDLQGRQVNPTANLHGIYIVRQGNQNRKVCY